MDADRLLPTSDPAPAFFDRAVGRISYVDEGPRDAPAFFTLHGIPGSVRDFRYLAPPLTPHVRLVRVDLPGFGQSAPDEQAILGLDGRGQAVVELADHLGLERFGLIGHSMGGGPALLLAAREPSRVSHLVLLASVGLEPHRGLGRSPWVFRAYGRALALPFVGSLLAAPVRREYQRRNFGGAAELTTRDLSQHLRSIGALDFTELRRAARAKLPPTLVAWSRDDRLLEPEIPAELARLIPGARALAFDHAGHNLQKTRAPEIAAAILELVR